MAGSAKALDVAEALSEKIEANATRRLRLGLWSGPSYVAASSSSHNCGPFFTTSLTF